MAEAEFFGSGMPALLPSCVKGGFLVARSLALFIAIIVVAALGAQKVDGVTISPQNPYRSFNISGINYGSMKWEKSHRKTSYPQRPSRGIVFRRR
jgi:hypothetical protein